MNTQAAQRRRVYYALRPKPSCEPAKVPSPYRPPYTAAARELVPAEGGPATTQAARELSPSAGARS